MLIIQYIIEFFNDRNLNLEAEWMKTNTMNIGFPNSRFQEPDHKNKEKSRKDLTLKNRRMN